MRAEFLIVVGSVLAGTCINLPVLLGDELSQRLHLSPLHSTHCGDTARHLSKATIGLSDWYGLDNIAEFMKIFHPGDRLEFSRTGFVHWGIYIGAYKSADHQVIHFNMQDGASKYSSAKSFSVPYSSSNEPEILLNSIEETLGNEGVRINNIRDEDWEPLSQTDVVSRAVDAYENKEDETFAPYYLLKKKCEHFVNWCRYHRKHSDQVYHFIMRPEFWMVVGLTMEGTSINLPVLLDDELSERLHLSPLHSTHLGDIARHPSKVKKSGWYDLNNIAEFLKIVNLGDRLEFSRKVYAHWGIYIGAYNSADHQVIHFSMQDGASKYSLAKSFSVADSSSNKPEILLNSIEETLRNEGVRMNNIRDEDWEPLSPTDIVGRAVDAYNRNKDNKTIEPYHLIQNNCEHFVNWCRYGLKHSDQVHQVHHLIHLMVFGATLWCIF